MNVNKINFLLDGSKPMILHFEFDLFSIISATTIPVRRYDFTIHYISLLICL